ncbi:unnamed protein product, partial [Meganyctiphanes norvegica]
QVKTVEYDRDRNGNPFIDKILQLVTQSKNDIQVTKAAAQRIESISAKKNCKVKQGSLSAFAHMLNYTCPKQITLHISSNPNHFPELLPLVQILACKEIKLWLLLDHLYFKTSQGEDDSILVPLQNNDKCKTVQFLGRLGQAGLEGLPRSLEVCALRIKPAHVPTLNTTLTAMPDLWHLGIALDATNNPPVESIPTLRYGGKELYLDIDCSIGDNEVAYAVALVAILCPRGRNTCEWISFWNTHLTSVGATRLLEELHDRGLNVIEYVGIQSKVQITQDQTTELNTMAKAFDLKKVVIAKW